MVRTVKSRKYSRRTKPWHGGKRRWRWLPAAILVLLCLATLLYQSLNTSRKADKATVTESLVTARGLGLPADEITCSNPSVTDGDTLRCGDHRIRLANIDAPEMPGHCRKGRRCTPGDPHAAKAYLEELTRGRVTCRAIETDRYGRTVALCEAGGRDLSCAMVEADHAVERYGSLSCP